MSKYDIVIVGAGPAGLGCAISAVKRELKTLLIDKGNVVNSIINFPVNMTFFSTADVLEIHDIPFNSMNLRPNRTEAVRYYQNLVKHFNISTELLATTELIEKKDEHFEVQILRGCMKIPRARNFRCQNLLKALPALVHHYAILQNSSCMDNPFKWGH